MKRAAVKTMNSNEGRLAYTALPPEELDLQDHVPGEAVVKMRDVTIQHGPAEMHYRPYLCLRGEVEKIRGAFPEGVGEVLFNPEDGAVRGEWNYRFSDKELAMLAEKGLFSGECPVPELFTESDFEMPVSCRVASVKGTVTPVIFVSLENALSMDTDQDDCGYDLADYFERVTQEEQEETLSYMEPEEVQGYYTAEEQKETQEEKAVPEVTEEMRQFRRNMRRISTRVLEKSKKDQERLKNRETGPITESDIAEIKKAVAAGSIEQALSQYRKDLDEGLDTKDISIAEDGSVHYGEEDEEEMRRRREVKPKEEPLTLFGPKRPSVSDDITVESLFGPNQDHNPGIDMDALMAMPENQNQTYEKPAERKLTKARPSEMMEKTAKGLQPEFDDDFDFGSGYLDGGDHEME